MNRRLPPAPRRRLTWAAAGLLAGLGLGEFLRGRRARAHLPLALAHACVLVPTLWRNCGWFGPVVTQFATTEREVWLTIDDGPDPYDTPRTLDVLEEFQCRATFGVIGRKALAFPGLCRDIVAAGHTLANHTQTHPAATFWACGPRRVFREIAACSETLEDVTGTRPSLFRAPVGHANPFVHETVEALGMTLLGWTLPGLDAGRYDRREVCRRLVGGVFPGAILVLHEGGRGGRRTDERARLLRRLLFELSQRGYRCVLPGSHQFVHTENPTGEHDG